MAKTLIAASVDVNAQDKQCACSCLLAGVEVNLPILALAHGAKGLRAAGGR